jgi:hypothetical protein
VPIIPKVGHEPRPSYRFAGNNAMDEKTLRYHDHEVSWLYLLVIGRLSPCLYGIMGFDLYRIPIWEAPS